MSREATLILVGVLVVLSPFSGLPNSWLAWLLPILGIIAGVIGYSLRAEKVATQRAETPASVTVRDSEAAA